MTGAEPQRQRESSTPTRRGQPLRLILLAVLALMTAGCLRAELDLEVRDDGSGSFQFIQAIDLRALESAGLGAVDSAELLPPDSDLPERVTAKLFEDGQFSGVEYNGTFDDVAQLDEDLTQVAQAADLGADFDVTISKTDAGWRFELPQNVTDVINEQAGALPGLGVLTSGAKIIFRVKLPGSVVDHNADRVEDGNRFVWDLGLDDDRRLLFAETSGSGGGGSGTTIAFIAGGLVLVSVLAAGLGFAMHSRNKRAKTPSAPAVSPDSWAQPASMPAPSAPPAPADFGGQTQPYAPPPFPEAATAPTHDPTFNETLLPPDVPPFGGPPLPPPEVPGIAPPAPVVPDPSIEPPPAAVPPPPAFPEAQPPVVPGHDDWPSPPPLPPQSPGGN